MSPGERDIVLLKELLDLIDLTVSRAPTEEREFIEDLDKRDATALRVQAIGEHIRALSPTIREIYPNLPWRDVIGMRNVIAHEYGSIDYRVVFDVVAGGDLTRFRDAISEILADTSTDE